MLASKSEDILREADRMLASGLRAVRARYAFWTDLRATNGISGSA